MTAAPHAPAATTRLAALRSRQNRLRDDLELLVTQESPSSDPVLTAACAGVVSEWAQSLLGVAPERVVIEGVTHLRWRFGGPARVLLVGHLDTVWPAGTLARWPFRVEGDTATGPGCFDMKAGLVQAVHALTTLDDLDGVCLLVTADEELGSPTSSRLVVDSAAGALAALVAEPSAGGALKTSRKGVGLYSLELAGRAAHAGLEPERGANAAVALAHAVLAAAALADPTAGTTVTPTLLAAGATRNTVPAAGSVALDVRVPDAAEEARVDAALRALSPAVPGTTLTVVGGPNRPPLPTSSSRDLFTLAQEIAAELGLPVLAGVGVGGGSDGNFTAGAGVPTLDGLGAVGDGAHAEGEHVVLSAMPDRAALLAGLVESLLAESP